MTRHAFTVDDQLCKTSHYAAIVEARKDVEIYQLGDVDCPSCLRRMADKHQAISDVFRARLAVIAPRGDVVDLPQALCHECLEMVEVVAGKLSPHRGTSGDGCSQNGAAAQIYLHPRAADRIVQLEAALVAAAPGGAR